MLNQKKILVADDEDFVRQLIVTKLKRYGIRIIEADNGVDAIEKAISEKPDLILLDTLMPKMNGFDASQRLKLNHETAHIPIIMLTTHADFSGMSTEEYSGSLESFTKPFVPQKLAERIIKILDQSERTGG